MSLLETTLAVTVWLISPRVVFAGDHFSSDSLVDISRVVFAGDHFSSDSLVDISRVVFAGDHFSSDSLVDISQRCLCWRPL